MEQKEDIFKYGIKGGHEVKEFHVSDFFKKVGMIAKPILIVVIFLAVITGIFFAGYHLKKCPVCPECPTCPACEIPQCPELDCSECPKQVEKVNIIKYACPSGLVAESLDECDPLNFLKITTPYKAVNNGVTISIDKIEYEIGDIYNKITEIDYTIINTGDHEIKPIVLVNIYSPEMDNSNWGLIHDTFDDDEYIKPDSWAIKREKTNIGFKESNITVRLVVKDLVPDPNKELVRVTRPLGI